MSVRWSVIVVDDEEIIRKGITRFINENHPGFYVVKSFEDGKAAIEYIRKNNVDLVITDIKMLGITGLDIARYIKENDINTEVIFISGYKDFEYAQTAIENNVSHYILKPFSNERILTVLDEMYKSIAKKKDSEFAISKYDDLVSAIRREFFVDILFGSLKNRANIIRRYEMLMLDFDIDTVCCAVVMVKWNDDFISASWSGSKEDADMASINFFNTVKSNKFADKIDEDMYIILSHCDDIDALLEDTKRVIKEYIGETPEIVLEYKCTGIYGLSDYYDNIRESGHNSIASEVMRERAKLFNAYMNLNMYDEAIELFRCIVGNYPSKSSKKDVTEFMHYLSEWLKASNADICVDSMLANMDAEAEPDVIVSHIIKEFKKFYSTERTIVTNIKNYLNQHYMEDITLDSISEQFYFKAVYMSRLFKEEAGETFSEYLFKLRMNKAIEFLKCNKYKIYQISEMVGYRSTKYFYKQFKKYTGYTPKAYARLVWNIQVDDFE